MFVAVVRELSAAVILFTSETKVLSVLIFDLKESGDLAAIAVLGLAMLILTAIVIIARQPHSGLRRRRAPAGTTDGACQRARAPAQRQRRPNLRWRGGARPDHPCRAPPWLQRMQLAPLRPVLPRERERYESPCISCGAPCRER